MSIETGQRYGVTHNVYRTGQRYGVTHLVDVLMGREKCPGQAVGTQSVIDLWHWP